MEGSGIKIQKELRSLDEKFLNYERKYVAAVTISFKRVISRQMFGNKEVHIYSGPLFWFCLH